MDEAMRAPKAIFTAVARNAQGRVLWEARAGNLVMSAAKNDLLSKYFAGLAYSAAWYLGIKDGNAVSASDTLASKGWTEITSYTGAARQLLVWGGASSGIIAATAIVFALNASVMIGGAFIASVPTGTSGVLYNAANFGSLHSLGNGDTLTVTTSLSAV